MKLLLASLAAVTLMIAVAPSAKADHDDRRFAGYDSCGRAVYSYRVFGGYDRCGHAVYTWRTPCFTPAPPPCRDSYSSHGYSSGYSGRGYSDRGYSSRGDSCGRSGIGFSLRFGR